MAVLPRTELQDAIEEENPKKGLLILVLIIMAILILYFLND